MDYFSPINNPSKLWLGGVYARVSTDHEEQQTSKIHQIQFFDEAHCQTYSISKIVETYVEENMSGTKADKRKEFQRLIKDARNGRINCIIAKSISRFARNQVDTIKIIRELNTKGVRFIFIEQGLDTLRDTQLLGLFAWMAEEESRTISKRRRFGGVQSAKSGNFALSKPPLGYRVENKKLVIVEEEAVIIRRIFDLFLGGYGTLRIAKILNEEGIKTRNGNRFGKSRINYILRNEAYKGWIIYGKRMNADVTLNQSLKRDKSEWTITKNAHEAIIPEETFDKVQTMFRDVDLTKAKKSVSIFAGVMKCKVCGHNMIKSGGNRRTSKNEVKTYFYYRCLQKTDRGASMCNSLSVREDHLKAILQKTLENSRSNIDYVKTYKEKGLKILKDKLSSNIDEKKINSKIDNINNMRLALTDKYLQGKISDDIYQKKEEEFSAQLNSLVQQKSKISELEMIYKKFSEGIEEYMNTIHNITDIDKVDNYTMRKLIDSIWVDAFGNIEIVMKVAPPQKSMEMGQSVKAVGPGTAKKLSDLLEQPLEELFTIE
ncbi:recombinase family protein [Paenibacillus elgii]|uniref:recombinase family protein n=1 Tax=Paenibacillus elgii TaxID=189691 RepID=UPI00203AF3A8|nr:recombinase family protein [Paenibacillus elgii]MCM3271126.1 recombinase family protein [Paenibacillus elgii]